MGAVALCHDGNHRVGALAHDPPDGGRDGCDGVGVGVHCIAPFVAGTSGDKDILPERPNPVKYLIDNTCQHLETSASTHSILPQFPTYSIGH